MSLGKEAKGSHMAVTLDIEVYEYIGRSWKQFCLNLSSYLKEMLTLQPHGTLNKLLQINDCF